jgi:hypothetical protein
LLVGESLSEILKGEVMLTAMNVLEMVDAPVIAARYGIYL